FVRSLVTLAPVVVFSAAIPEQGGVDHLNEQWPEYWANLFASHDYCAVDCLRSKIWNKAHVQWWYAQNTIFYVDLAMLGSYPILQASQQHTDATALALVHPRNYLNKVNNVDHVYYRPDPDRFCLSTLIALAPRVLANAMRHRLGLGV